MKTFCKDAGDLLKIAVNMAGFDVLEVILEIQRLQRDTSRRVALPTIEQALGNIREKSLTPEDKLKRQQAYNKLMTVRTKTSSTACLSVIP